MKKKVLLFGVILVALIGLATTAVVIGVNSNKVDTESEETATGDSGKSSDSNNSSVKFLNKDAKLSDVKKVEGVVNIYMFWGNGCPHCKAQWEWLETLREEYEGKIAVYGFEVFNNSVNRAEMDVFADAMGDKDVNSVPYTIIGNESISGFGNSSTTGKKILEAVEKAQENGKDIYFDKVVKSN